MSHQQAHRFPAAISEASNLPCPKTGQDDIDNVISDKVITGPYEVIYADPPWRYDFIPVAKDKVENHYSTMPTPEICALQFNIAKNAVLYLWVTAPKLPDGLEVMKAWGFTYKTQMVWDKGSPAYGYWFRGQHEILLVGTRGKFSPPGKYERIPSVWRETRTGHSVKPKGIRDLIKQWFPHAKRLEVFARDLAEGWDCWGNEVADCCTSEKRRMSGLFPVSLGAARPTVDTPQFPGKAAAHEGNFVGAGGAAEPGRNTAGTGCPPTAS